MTGWSDEEFWLNHLLYHSHSGTHLLPAGWHWRRRGSHVYHGPFRTADAAKADSERFRLVGTLEIEAARAKHIREKIAEREREAKEYEARQRQLAEEIRLRREQQAWVRANVARLRDRIDPKLRNWIIYCGRQEKQTLQALAEPWGLSKARAEQVCRDFDRRIAERRKRMPPIRRKLARPVEFPDDPRGEWIERDVWTVSDAA